MSPVGTLCISLVLNGAAGLLMAFFSSETWAIALASILFGCGMAPTYSSAMLFMEK